MKNRWFTLVEILIVVMLFGLLAGLIMQTYITISQVSFRLHQEKEIAKEALVLSQVLENLAQTTTIDYDQYQSKTLIENNGIVEKLYLKGNNGEKYQISTSWNCLSSQALYSEKNEKSDSNDDAPCGLEMITTSWDEVQTNLLLDGKLFKLTTINFKVIPFIWNSELSSELNKENPSANLPSGGQPAFWLLGALYSNYYQPNKRSNNILLPLQLFFSLQWETASLYSPINNDATQTPES